MTMGESELPPMRLCCLWFWPPKVWFRFWSCGNSWFVVVLSVMLLKGRRNLHGDELAQMRLNRREGGGD